MATIRTTVNLPEGEYHGLKSLAERREISFTHALRQAIQSELFIQDLVDAHSKLIVQTEDGDLQQLVFTQAAQGAAAHTPPQAVTEAAAAQTAPQAVTRVAARG